MTAVELDPWDLRHLLLSLEDQSRTDPDGADLERVVVRAVAALARLPARPVISVTARSTGPLLVEGVPSWVLETNSWLLAPDGAGGECLVVDVPPVPEMVLGRIRALGLTPVGIVLTHGHADHCGGAAWLLSALGADVPVHVHPADRERVLHPEQEGVFARLAPGVVAPPASVLVPLADGAVLDVGSLTVRAVHVPGHTPGSTCVVADGGTRPLLFTGDTLFAGGSGRCDLGGGSRWLADASLRSHVAPLPDDTVILPGHGGVTTLAAERLRNAALGTVVKGAA